MAFCRKMESAMESSMIALLVLAGLLSRANATLYTVGGASGWIELRPGSLSYNAQFKDIRLEVGDQLFFPFQQGVHNVFQVDSTAIGTCNASSPIAVSTATNATITLSSPGFWGFICEIDNHCRSGGMRLGVTVQSSGAPPAGPTPTPAPASTPTSSTAAPEPSMASPAPSPSDAAEMGEMHFRTSGGPSLAFGATSVIFFSAASALLALLG